LFLGRQVNGLARPNERDESLHHVHLNVAVDEEVAPQVERLRSLVRLMAMLQPRWQEQHRRGFSLDDE
jgi:hypothetical protein